MKNNIERLLDRAEDLGWSIEKENGNLYRLAKFSPEGQDFSFQVDIEDDSFIENMYKAYENFDVSEETYLWLDESGHGMNGSPWDMKDLYNDMECCEAMMLDLYTELLDLVSEIENEEDEDNE